MIQVAPGTRVYLACQPISMRKGFDGLAAEVANILKADPFSGSLFIFRSKRGQRPTFDIQFSTRDDRVPLAPAVRTHIAGVAAPARQGAEVHLYGRAAKPEP